MPVYPPRSPSDLLNVINITGRRSYEGAQGLASMLSNLDSLILARGIFTVSNGAALANISPADAQIVAIKNVGLYLYNPSVDTSGSPFNVNSPIGFWEYLCPLHSVPRYVQFIGDSVSTAITVAHNLNSEFVSVLILEPVTPGQAYPYTVFTDYATTLADANTLTVTFLTIPGTQQYKIIVTPL